MLERQFFRFTLLAAGLIFFFIGGISTYRFFEATKLQIKIENIIEYQKRMEKPCKSKPEFPACLSNEEYLVKYLTAVKEEVEVSTQARALFPWAIFSPLVLLITFYAIRWGITGRIRPFWLIRSTPHKP